MATPLSVLGPRGAKRKPRKKPRKALPPPGRAPLQNTVHVRSIGMGGKRIEFTFSEDVMQKLLDMHEGRYAAFYYTTRAQRMHRRRLQFVRLKDLNIAGVMVMIEPPTYDPRGWLVKRVGRRFTTAVSARFLGLKNGIPKRPLMNVDDAIPGEPVWYYAENMFGLIIMLPDEDMLTTPTPRPKPGDPWDLVARR
jgi:hypothetical protein